MKKHLFLTSLVAIAATTSVASATTHFDGVIAGETVSFDGQVNHTYKDANGKQITEAVFLDDEDLDLSKPQLADYHWLNDETDTALTEAAMKYTEANFKAAASFDKDDAKSLQAGQKISMNNYKYTYGDEEYILSVDKDGSFVANGTYTETVDVADALEEKGIELAEGVTIADSIVVTNGKSVEPEIHVGKYVLKHTVGDNDQNVYRLEDPANKDVEVPVADNTELSGLFENAKGVYEAVSAAIAGAVQTTQGKVDAESDAAETVLANYKNDADTLQKLNASFESLKDARNTFNHDSTNYDEIVKAQEFRAAPIAETIDSRADERIELSLNEGGAIRSAINEGVSEAKAYADAGDALTLSKANAYTDKKFDSLEKDMSGGVAAATALSAVSVSGVNKGEVSVGGGYGYYNGQSAMAFGAAMGLTDRWSINAGAGVASGDSTQFSIRAGTNYKFKLF